MEILLLSKFFGHVIKNLDGSGFPIQSPRTLRVLGLSDFTSPWTTAKTATPIYIFTVVFHFNVRIEVFQESI